MGQKEIRRLLVEVEEHVDGFYRQMKENRIDINFLLCGANNLNLWPVLAEAYNQEGDYVNLERWEYLRFWDILSGRDKNFVRASLRLHQLETDRCERDKGGRLHCKLWEISELVPDNMGGYLAME